MDNYGEILIYQTENGLTKIDVSMQDETVWLTNEQMAELFQKSKSTINEHIKNIYLDGELQKLDTMKKFGNTEFSTKPTNFYNLDVVISVGYRVKSQRGVHFRIWATNILIKSYFKKDIDGYYLDKKSNERKLKGVSCQSDRTRNEKAVSQASFKPSSFSKVYSYINEFLELIRVSNGFLEKNIIIDTIELGGITHQIIDNGILIRDNNWISPKWVKGKGYTIYDKKYDVIMNKFDLERVSDILWFKFTEKGHLAVVAGGCDINWDETLSCGILLNEVQETFDTSFVFVFPLTKHMIRTKVDPNSYYRKYSSAHLELAVGNYLIKKGIPIIDYYSHMGYKYK